MTAPRTPYALVAALALAPTAHAATSGTGSQALTADVEATLTATFPGDHVFADLVPGTSTLSAGQTLNVKSNLSWGVRLDPDAAAMRPHDGSSYSGSALQNALEWRVSELGGSDPGAAFAALSGNLTDVATGRSQTTDAGEDVEVTYRQTTSFADEVLSSGAYRILVVYTALQGI